MTNGRGCFCLLIFLYLFIKLIRSEMLESSAINFDSLLEHSKRLPPKDFGEPFNVKLGFYVESLGNFRHTEMTFDVDLYLYLSWTDARLQHLEDDEVILVNTLEGLEKLWKPDLYFANARTSYFHEVTVPNFNLFIDRNGTVAYSTR
uniref:Neurotransmitter-gated ion-channel ligand-binding domain-containing protein n=1 Tax=Acrobeloides nanus TaxID=290746 RepID=A0A914C0R6_9BILA